MATDVVIAVGTRGVDAAARSITRLEGQSSKFGKALAGVVAGGAIVAAVAVTKFAVASTRAASDSQQSLGATETVFGKFSRTVVRESNRAAKAYGLSANQYRENANLIGSLFKGQGVEVDKLAGKTRKMIGTAADLSATFGGTTSNAVEALSSAFKGEFDPLERYGISIKQSDINARLAAKGQEKLTGAALKQASQLATTELITRQAAQTNGAFAKETDTLAHQQQVLGAQWTNIKAIAGKALLPVLTTLGATLSSDVLPPFARLARQYAPEVGDALDDLAKAFGPRIRDAIDDVPDLIDSLRSGGGGNADFKRTGSDLSTIADGVREASAALPSFNDYLKVSGTVIGFAADHVDTLAKAMPFLVGGFVAYKSAQLLNQTVGRDSLIGFGLQLAATRSLTIANRQLAAAVTQVNTAQRGAVGAAGAMTSETSRLARGARVAGGAAGLGALALGAEKADTKVGALATIGGGALLGFSVGGPIGAAVGGTAGALLALSQNAGKAGDAATIQVPKFDSLRDSLDGVTAASTEATRAAVQHGLAENGTLQLLNQYGISGRAAVSAILGEKSAREQVGRALQSERVQRNAALTEAARLQQEYDTVVGSGSAEENQRQQLAKLIAARKEEAAAHDQAIQTVRKATGTYRDDVLAKRAEIAATRDYSGLLKGLPAAARTKIRADGIEPTMKAVVDLARQYRLVDRKQIKTTLKAAGFDGTKKQIEQVRARLGDLESTRPNLSPALRSVQQFAASAKREALQGATGVSDQLSKGTGKARANLGQFRTSLDQGIGAAKTSASSGGHQTGNALGQGLYIGVDVWGGPIASRAAAIVRAAVAAARAAADAHSPSRKTEQLGKDLGEGLVLGMRSTERRAKTEAQKLVAAVRDGVVRGSAGFEQAWQRVTAVVDRTLEQQQRAQERSIRKSFAAREKAAKKNLEGKAENKRLAELERAEKKALKQLEKTSKRRARVVAKGLADERAALAANAKAQDANTAKLEDARQAVLDLQQARTDYAASVRDTVVATGSIATLGEGTGFGSVAQLIAQRKAAVEEATKFNAVIAKLRGKLNDTDLQNLIDQGPTSLGVAEAIAAGGPAAITELNNLQKQLITQGSALGEAAAQQFKDAGIKAAQGIVAGLESQAAKLDRQAVKLANALVKAVKKALGIKSPSRAFAGIGENVVKGLNVGLDDTYVRRSGAQLAASLQKGFAKPRLEALLDASTSPAFQRIPIVFSAQEVDQLRRGREIQADLDAYSGLGRRSS